MNRTSWTFGIRTGRRLATAVALLATIAAPAVAQQPAPKQRFASIEDAARASGILSGRQGPRNVNWIDNGARFSYLDRDPRTGKEIIREYDPATGRDTLLFSAQGMNFPDSATQPFAYESFQWAHDSKNLVFQTRFEQLYRRSGTSDYFVYNIAGKSLKLATRRARTAELSPDGRLLGSERGGNMYVTDLATGREKQLTRGATEHVFNGHFDWVYEEEFGLAQAWSWSPDSRHIAFWQVDERAEPTIQLTDYEGRHPSWDSLRIPQPGDSNPKVKIGVSDVTTGKLTWLNTGEKGEFYIPRIYWTGARDTLAVITLNRKQNDMKLFFFDVKTGGRRQVMEETAKAWIDVYDFYAGIDNMMTFPEGTHEFFWISDRSGFQHIYRYDYSGKLLGQVTKGDWSVTRIEGIDPKTQTIWYTSTEVSPLERHLYAIHFDGSGKQQLTTQPGTHSINMSPNGQFYIDRWSSLTQPVQVELWRTGQGKLRTLEDNAATTQWLATHEYSPTEVFHFTTSDGVGIDASMVKPVPFDSTKKYPVVFAVYGGPGSQGVYRRFNASGWVQWLAQQGYIVVDVNNRGTNNYGSAFMKSVYKQLGTLESHDFAETAKYISKLPYVDGNRIGIMGTSYGGYSTLYSMEMYPDVFRVGVENSGVADWRLYDTIYTERYMSTLEDNEEGYEKSSAVVNAPKLKGKLMIVHAMMDDNVHPQNTMQLLTAFANAGTDIEVRLYPPGHHGSAYNMQSYMLIQKANFAYLERWLKGAQQ